MMDKQAWHFFVWNSFNRKIFKDTINVTNITNEGKEYFINEVTQINEDNTTELIPVNRRFVKAKKEDKLYLIPREYVTRDMSIYPGKRIHCYLKQSDGIIYRLIQKPEILQLKPEMTIPFRIFIDEVWNPMEHSSPKDRIFLALLSHATSYKGVKCCICSEPRSMKNSNFTVARYIHNNIIRLGKPSYAKLYQSLCYNQTILPDEFTSLTKAQISEVEGTFGTLGDESPELPKNTMAIGNNPSTADLIRTSIIFTYQRKQDLSKDKAFFDDIWNNPAMIKDRYPALLIKGKVLEIMKRPSPEEAEKIMEDNYDKLRIIAKNRLYYCKNMHLLKKPFDTGLSVFNNNGRYMSNFEGVFDALSAYCYDQEEYNEWLIWINQRYKEYESMVNGNNFESDNTVFEEINMSGD